MPTVSAEEPRRDWKLFALIARTIVGGLFVISALGKIMDLSSFADEVRDYQMLPVQVTNAVAYILPWVELFAGALLITTLWRREARFVIGALLVIFTLAKSWTYAHGIDIRGCGCSGSLRILDYIYDTPQGILTNIILLVLLAVDHRAQRLSRRRSAGTQVPAGVSAGRARESR